jgi:hypothetical protein
MVLIFGHMQGRYEASLTVMSAHATYHFGNSRAPFLTLSDMALCDSVAARVHRMDPVRGQGLWH